MFRPSFTNFIKENISTSIHKTFEKLISEDVLTRGCDAGFRFYQKEQWKAFLEIFHNDEEHAGLFQAATGTGKTEVFKFFIPYLLCNAVANNDIEGKVFGIICHRHSLINDLNKRIFPILFNPYKETQDSLHFFKDDVSSGIGLDRGKVKFYIVNSGTVLKDVKASKEDSEALYEKENLEFKKCEKAIRKATFEMKHINQCRKKIVEEVEENRKNGIHSFFICLYQSIGIKENSTVMQKLNFDMIIADEIHALNSMSNDIGMNNINFYQTVKKAFYFTATPQFDKCDERYNNGGFQVI